MSHPSVPKVRIYIFWPCCISFNSLSVLTFSQNIFMIINLQNTYVYFVYELMISAMMII